MAYTYNTFMNITSRRESAGGAGGGERGRGQRVSSVFHYWVGMGGRSDVERSIYLYICIARTTTVR